MQKRTLLVSLVVALSFLGIYLAGYSIYEHILVKSGIETAGSICNINETINCKGVIQSKWSTFLGLPIGAFGIGFYVFVLCSLLWCRIKESDAEVLAPATLFATVSLLCSIFLFFISKFVIGVLCPVCLSMYLVNLLIFVLLFFLVRDVGFFTLLKLSIFKFKDLPVVFLLSALAVFASPQVVTSVAKKVVAQSQLKLSREEQIERAFRAWSAQKVVEIEAVDDAEKLKDYSHGPQDAPITLVEFFDFECPACRSFYSELKSLESEFKDLVQIQYRNYPLDNSCNASMEFALHRSACDLAEFSRCAGEQGQYLAVLDALMKLPEIDEEGSPEKIQEALKRVVSELRLDDVAMQECLASDRQLTKIKGDIKVANDLELAGTPSIWINGKAVPGVGAQLLRRIFRHLQDGQE